SEFNCPNAIAIDAQGRVLVGDRTNNRIQIFDQDGNFLEEWKQFGRPSGIFIDAKDNLYVSGLQLQSGVALSDAQLRFGTRPDVKSDFKQGIRIGSARDG